MAKEVRSEAALIGEHLDLVHKMVSQLSTRLPAHVRRDDLVSAGMSGLVLAARQFDPARGVPFERYAVNRVRGALLDELRASDWASRPVRARARAVASTTDALTIKLGRPPTTDELSQACGISAADLSRLSDDVHRAVVINYESVLETGDSEMLLPISPDDPEEQLLSNERAAVLVKAIAALPHRHRVVVRGYFFEERTVADLSSELNVTPSRVSQLRAEAMELLRDGVNAQLDPSRMSPLRPLNGRLSRRKATYRATMARQGTPVPSGHGTPVPGGRGTAVLSGRVAG